MSQVNRILSGAAEEIEFCDRDKDGKRIVVRLRMSPMTDQDISEMDAWIQARMIRNARASLDPNLSEKEREETMRVAMSTALTLTWMSGIGAKMIGTVDGLARLVWQAIHRNHPDKTVEDIRRLLLTKENIEEANRAFTAANPRPDGVLLKKEPIKPTPKRPKKRP